MRRVLVTGEEEWVMGYTSFLVINPAAVLAHLSIVQRESVPGVR